MMKMLKTVCSVVDSNGFFMRQNLNITETTGQPIKVAISPLLTHSYCYIIRYFVYLYYGPHAMLAMNAFSCIL